MKRLDWVQEANRAARHRALWDVRLFTPESPDDYRHQITRIGKAQDMINVAVAFVVGEKAWAEQAIVTAKYGSAGRTAPALPPPRFAP